VTHAADSDMQPSKLLMGTALTAGNSVLHSPRLRCASPCTRAEAWHNSQHRCSHTDKGFWRPPPQARFLCNGEMEVRCCLTSNRVFSKPQTRPGSPLNRLRAPPPRCVRLGEQRALIAADSRAVLAVCGGAVGLTLPLPSAP